MNTAVSSSPSVREPMGPCCSRCDRRLLPETICTGLLVPGIYCRPCFESYAYPAEKRIIDALERD